MYWYLGPLGDLRKLVCPEKDLTASQIRYGGTHQGLSGARTLDVTGHRAEYQLEVKWLDESEYFWLEAMHTRMIPGPYYLLDPLHRNRLSVQATGLHVSPSERSGVRIPATAQYAIVRDFPSEIALPGRSIKIQNWTGSTGRVDFDWDRRIPFMEDEVASVSVYVRADASHNNAYLSVDWYDSDLVPISTTNSSTFNISTSWVRRSMTNITPPPGATCAGMALRLTSANTPVYFAAPQFEAASSLSSWGIGGGAPEVLIEQLPTISPRFPLRNVSLNLLEA